MKDSELRMIETMLKKQDELNSAIMKEFGLTTISKEQIEQLEVRGADYYHELLDTLYDLVEKETATTPDIEGDGYYKGELVYDTWICPRCGTRYEIDYDEYEYCPKCGQHIDLDSLEQECEDTDDEE